MSRKCGDCWKYQGELCPMLLEADDPRDCDNIVWPKPESEQCESFEPREEPWEGCL